MKEKPCSSERADCELKANEFEPQSGKQLGAKPKKTLMFDPSKTFTPGQSTKAEPPITPNLTLSNVSAPGFTIPVTSIPMKLPKSVLDKFSGDPLEWPEWSGQFLATVDQGGVADSVKMKYLKTLVSGKAKAAGMGYSGAMYQVAWQILEHDFGRPELIVNAQLRKLHSHPFIKPHDSLEIIKFSQVVSGCVNVLSQFGYQSDLGSESGLNSVVRKLPIELKNKWLTYLQRYDCSYKTLRVFTA